MLRIAMGRLGWTPEVALNTDVQLILLAYEGHEDALGDIERMLFASQGVRLPPQPDRDYEPAALGKAALSAKFRRMAAEHNERQPAGKKRKTRQVPPP